MSSTTLCENQGRVLTFGSPSKQIECVLEKKGTMFAKDSVARIYSNKTNIMVKLIAE